MVISLAPRNSGGFKTHRLHHTTITRLYYFCPSLIGSTSLSGLSIDKEIKLLDEPFLLLEDLFLILCERFVVLQDVRVLTIDDFDPLLKSVSSLSIVVDVVGRGEAPSDDTAHDAQKNAQSHDQGL